MQRDLGENAPRGTWNDDTASERAADPRRSVSGPYRDPRAAAHLRKAALQRELDEIDRHLTERAELAAELVAVDRELRRAERPSGLAPTLRAASRLVAVLAIGGFGVAAGVALGEHRAAERAAQAIVVVPAETIVRGQEPFIALSRREVDDIVGRTDIEPVVERDAIVGLRVLRAGDAHGDTFGLERGDVIVAVNGHEIMRPDGARLALETVRSADQFVLTVQRNGSARYLRYQVGKGASS